MRPEWVSLKHIMSAIDWKHYDSPMHGPYQLNIVGVRTLDDSANTFNDWICFFRRTIGPEWEFYAYQATTDPGMYWRKNPMNVDGVAIVIPGQYHNLWGIGQHHGKYEALVQIGEIDVWRDNNGDGQLTTSKVHRGMFGINLHRASADHVSTEVDKWSAGCQVLANPGDHAFAMQMCHNQIKNTPIRYFSYTLLEQQDLESLNV